MVIKYNGVTLTNIVDDIRFRLAHDETLDSYEFEEITTINRDVKVGEFVYIDDVPFLISNFDKTPNIDGSFYVIKYSVLEAIAVLQSVIMPNMTFTQRLDGSKTLLDVINRLFRICKTNVLNTSISAPVKFYELDSSLNTIFNTPTCEFFFNNYTLFDALVEIGEYIGYFPRLMSDLKTVTFINLDRKGAEVSVTHESVAESHSIDEYANTFRINGENLIHTQNYNVKYPTEVTTQVADEVVEMVSVNTSYDDVTISDGNARITVNQPIFKVLKVEMFVNADANTKETALGSVTNGWWKIIANRKMLGLDLDAPLDKWCVDRKTWQGLKPTWFLSAKRRGITREHTMYYDIGGYDIFNLNDVLTDDFQPPADVGMRVTQNLNRDNYDETTEPDIFPSSEVASIYLRDLIRGERSIRSRKFGFRVTYIPMSNNFQVIKKNKGTVDWIKSEQLSGSYVDANRASKYADRQIKSALSRNYDYSLLTTNNIQSGQVVDGRLINIVSGVIKNGYKDITLNTLTEFHRKSSMINVNRNPNPFEISTDRVTQRITHVIHGIRVQNTNVGLNPINDWYKNATIQALLGIENGASLVESSIVKFLKSDNSYTRLVLPVNKTAFSGSVVYKTETYDNIIAGVVKSLEPNLLWFDDDVKNQRGIIYTDENGEVNRVTVDFISGGILNKTRDEYKVDFPLLEDEEVADEILLTNHVYLDKDTREMFIYNLQIDFDGIEFTDYGLLRSRFVSNNLTTPVRVVLYDRILTILDHSIKWFNNDYVASGTISSLIGGSTATIIHNANYSNPVSAMGVYDGSGALLYFINYDTPTVVNNTIQLYIGGTVIDTSTNYESVVIVEPVQNTVSVTCVKSTDYVISVEVEPQAHTVVALNDQSTDYFTSVSVTQENTVSASVTAWYSTVNTVSISLTQVNTVNNEVVVYKYTEYVESFSLTQDNTVTIGVTADIPVWVTTPSTAYDGTVSINAGTMNTMGVTAVLTSAYPPINYNPSFVMRVRVYSFDGLTLLGTTYRERGNNA